MANLDPATYTRLHNACTLRQAIHLEYNARRNDSLFSWSNFLQTRAPEIADFLEDAEVADAPAVLVTRFEFLLDWPTPPSPVSSDRVYFAAPDVVGLSELADIASHWTRPWLTGNFGDALLHKGTFDAVALRAYFMKSPFNMDMLFRGGLQ